jgi:[ribosomal protein S5]-alanine N-acetyltransferase
MADRVWRAERRTARLLLRRPTEDDIGVLFAIHADPDTNRFNPAGPMTVIEQAARRFREWDRQWRDHGFGYWAVSELAGAEDQVIGFAGIRYGSWRQRSVLNLYYRFTPSTWGRGFATEAATEAVDLWQSGLTADPVVAYTRPDNLASQRTALKAGLERRPDLDSNDGAGPATVFALGWV